MVPSNVQSANREALLYVFEDNEDVIKMIMKGRSPNNETWFPEPIELHLTGCSDRNKFVLQNPNQITSTPKNQLADILTKGNFTRDEWNHC